MLHGRVVYRMEFKMNTVNQLYNITIPCHNLGSLDRVQDEQMQH